MSALKYFPPFLSPTGHLLDQPRAEQTCSGWYLDANCAYNEAGFLDAPSAIPSGGTRALDTETLRLGVSHVWREAPGAYS